MIFYGTGTKELISEKVYEKCPNCEAQNSTTISVIQKYAHLYWIPLFPSKKVAISHCEQCEHLLEGPQFSDKLKEAHARLKLNIKTPLWTFSGIAIIVTLITALVINTKMNTKLESKLVASPKIGDIYEIKYNYEEYSLLKVDEIYKDSVFVLAHEYIVTKRQGLPDLKRDGNAGYTDKGFVFSKKDLIKMFKEDEIIGVDRN